MNKHVKNILLAASLALFSAMCVAADGAPRFKLPSEKGIVDLGKLRGQVVYVDFWASWCPPCQKSFPWMNEMHTKYRKKGLKIVAINVDDSREPIAKFLKRNPADFTIAYDPGGNTAKKYNLQGMPTSYIIDRKGKIQKIHVGFRKRDEAYLEKQLLAALSGS